MQAYDISLLRQAAASPHAPLSLTKSRDVVLAYLSFLWLCRPAAACCSDEPPRVLEPELVPTFPLPDFLWLWLPAAACCCDVPPRVPDPALLLPDVPEDLLSFLPI